MFSYVVSPTVGRWEAGFRPFCVPYHHVLTAVSISLALASLKFLFVFHHVGGCWAIRI